MADARDPSTGNAVTAGRFWLWSQLVVCAGCLALAVGMSALALPSEAATPSTSPTPPVAPKSTRPSGAAPSTPEAAEDATPAHDAVREISDVTYVRRGPVELKADVYLPSGNGPFPGVLMVHGGAWRMGSKRSAAPLAREMARRGYSVMAINYRLAPTHKFPSQLDDCRDAVRFMRREAAHYKIDMNRVAGCGYSAGGHLVCLLAAESAETSSRPGQKDQPDTRLQAVVAGGAPCDFRLFGLDDDFLSYWLGGTRRQVPEQYKAASPRAFVSPDDPPMFIYHGDSDRLVPPLSATAMVATLRQFQVPAELHVVRGAGHIQAYLDREAFTKGIDFLDRTLKPATADREGAAGK